MSESICVSLQHYTAQYPFLPIINHPARGQVLWLSPASSEISIHLKLEMIFLDLHGPNVHVPYYSQNLSWFSQDLTGSQEPSFPPGPRRQSLLLSGAQTSQLLTFTPGPFSLPLASALHKGFDNLLCIEAERGQGEEEAKGPRSSVTRQFRRKWSPGKYPSFPPSTLLPLLFMETKWIWGETSVLLWEDFICLFSFSSVLTLSLLLRVQLHLLHISSLPGDN